MRRAVAVLRVMAESPKDLGVSEVSKALGIAGATAFRTLYTLGVEGLVKQDAETKRYRLGVDLAVLGQAAADGFDLRREALPIMERLSSEIGMPTYLNIAGSSEVVCIEHVATLANIDLYGRTGRTMPYYACPSGYVLLAFGPPELLKKVMSAPLRKFASKSIVEPAALQKIIDEIRKQGYAYAESDLEEGVASVSAPILDHRGDVVAALGLAGFTVMFEGHERRFTEALLGAAREISTNSGSRSKGNSFATESTDVSHAFGKKLEGSIAIPG